MAYETLIAVIQQKKPLDKLDDEMIKKSIQKFLTKKTDTENSRAASFKTVVKKVRNELNVMYGQYWQKQHTSLKEREEISPRLYKKIIPKNTKTVLDLGCGKNPLTYKYIFQKCFFYCVELTKKDCEDITKILKREKLKGEVIQGNMLEIELPKTDVTLLFKILDQLDTRGHKNAYTLIKKIQSPTIIVSFATKTLKNQEMRQPRRIWFEHFLERERKTYTIHQEPNELFYVITKS